MQTSEEPTIDIDTMEAKDIEAAVFDTVDHKPFRIYSEERGIDVIVKLDDDGELKVFGESELTRDQLYDELAFAADVIAPVECYFYEELEECDRGI